MRSGYGLGLVGALVTLVLVFEMLRRRYLREKYAVLWLVVGVAVAVTAIFPTILFTVSSFVGVSVPTNFVFFVGGLILLVAHVQLSYESGRLEERTRVLAEQVALLDMQLRELRGERPPVDGRPAPPMDER